MKKIDPKVMKEKAIENVEDQLNLKKKKKKKKGYEGVISKDYRILVK